MGQYISIVGEWTYVSMYTEDEFILVISKVTETNIPVNENDDDLLI